VLRALLVLVIAMTATSSAHAEPWYKGRYGKNRILHLSIAVGGFVAYPLMKPLEKRWAAETCRWCTPTGVDARIRNSLVWDDRTQSDDFSDYGSYFISPALSFGLVAFGTVDDASWASVIDDFTPILESMVITQFVTAIIKVSVGRQRPYAHYTAPMDHEDNLSFPSGHGSRAFSLVTSAAMVARARGYKIEPVIWAVGLTVASASAYLRIGADKHYFTDVLGGAVVGSAIGLTVPSLMCRNSITLVPQRNGVAFAGEF